MPTAYIETVTKATQEWLRCNCNVHEKSTPHVGFYVRASFSISSMCLFWVICVWILLQWSPLSVTSSKLDSCFDSERWCDDTLLVHNNLVEIAVFLIVFPYENVSPSFPVFNCLNHHHDFHFNTFMYCHQNGEVKKHTFNKFQPILLVGIFFLVSFFKQKSISLDVKN